MPAQQTDRQALGEITELAAAVPRTPITAAAAAARHCVKSRRQPTDVRRAIADRKLASLSRSNRPAGRPAGHSERRWRRPQGWGREVQVHPKYERGD